MKIELIDKFGTQIEATFFNEAADFWFNKIDQGKVYDFMNGSVRIANKKFTTVKNDLCLIFEKNSEIIQVEDDGLIQK